MEIIKAPTQPEDMNNTFAKAYNSGNVDNIDLLFEMDAKVVTYDKSIISGRNEYHKEHLNLLKLGGKMTSVNQSCIIFEDIALLSAEWKINTRNEDGRPMEISGKSTEVIRKQKDGTWLYVIDNPFGN
ncbi:hypothetical protein GCM10022216_16700 [Sphingobacterium kyonggiense]|uniref:DUF4440 domain-containing protein n=1 Tax=Sphingobacterium kyonggiense TaxID=714075 RepID=A0ABP7YNS7_9SPHI